MGTLDCLAQGFTVLKMFQILPKIRVIIYKYCQIFIAFSISFQFKVCTQFNKNHKKVAYGSLGLYAYSSQKIDLHTSASICAEVFTFLNFFTIYKLHLQLDTIQNFCELGMKTCISRGAIGAQWVRT